MMMAICAGNFLLLLMILLSGKILIATEEEIEELIKRIQQFDPPGVCARDLQECLLLQLQRQKAKEEMLTLAMKVVR